MPETQLQLDQFGDVLVATMVPQGSVSSFSLPLLAQFDALSDRAEQDDDVRAVIITGTGRTFNIGTDVDQIASGLADFTQFRRYLSAFKATMNRLERLPVPTVAAVNGLARAGGLELVLVCDVALIGLDARIGDCHSPQYAIPAGGSTQRLPRRIGMARAKDLIWSGDFLTAEQAVQSGLCHAATSRDELLAEAFRLVARYTDKPRACLEESKALLLASGRLDIDDGCEAEIQAFLNYVHNTPYVRTAFEQFRAARGPAHSPAHG